MHKSDEGKTVSYWEATGNLIDGNGAPQDVVDVCVVGGGIAGLTTAYLLTKAGRRVVVVDDGLIGGGETCRTTAHLSNAIDDRIYRIEEWHGEEKARLAVESHGAAIDRIEAIVNDEGIDCDFARLDGYLFDADENGDDDLEKEIAAAHRCGLTDVDWVDKAPVDGLYDGRCLRFPRQAQFHILRYLGGLAKALEAGGGQLISGKHVTEWTGGDTPSITTDDGLINARSLVLATNYPLMSKMFAELPAYRTYVIGVEMPEHSVDPALFWDTADPYHYVRTQDEKDKQILLIGGEDHRTGQENDGEVRFQRLLCWAQKHFAVKGDVVFSWSGQFMETHDGLAFIGQYSEDEPNVYLITGDSGMGMTHGTIGGMLVSDLILVRENPWTGVFDPSRLASQSLKEAVPEIIDSTVPYKDWLTGGDVDAASEIKKGEGAIIRDGFSKIAVYRDEDGNLHKRSAVCTHMGCIVRFNSLEKTWDCPCHGSRFSIDGCVINSPAISALMQVE